MTLRPCPVLLFHAENKRFCSDATIFINVSVGEGGGPTEVGMHHHPLSSIEGFLDASLTFFQTHSVNYRAALSFHHVHVMSQGDILQLILEKLRALFMFESCGLMWNTLRGNTSSRRSLLHLEERQPPVLNKIRAHERKWRISFPVSFHAKPTY